MARPIQRFEISLKALLVDGPRLLLLKEAATDLWELPGGRIDVGEEWLPRETILRREMLEELGEDARIEIGGIAATWCLRRPDGQFVYMIGHRCTYLGGRLRLSDEHLAHAWVTGPELDAYPLVPESGYAAMLRAFFAENGAINPS